MRGGPAALLDLRCRPNKRLMTKSGSCGPKRSSTALPASAWRIWSQILKLKALPSLLQIQVAKLEMSAKILRQELQKMRIAVKLVPAMLCVHSALAQPSAPPATQQTVTREQAVQNVCHAAEIRQGSEFDVMQRIEQRLGTVVNRDQKYRIFLR